RLSGIVTVAATSTKPVVVMGDLNGRTGSCTASTDSPTRSSLDTKSNSRGTWITKLCKDNNLEIINGTQFESSVPGELTSFQPNGSSVIDYVLISKAALPLLENRCMTVVRSSLSDHASPRLTI
ncbi:hypothetical protein BT96DRAFT_745827, partial [Gymnopus androsaceus JB14]